MPLFAGNASGGLQFFLIDGQEYDPSVPVDKVARLEFQVNLLK
jgi:hypothetical protein